MRINRRISPTDASYPTGMMFFPTKMMEGYKAGTFKGDGNTVGSVISGATYALCWGAFTK